jgi:hypothetical protein
VRYLLEKDQTGTAVKKSPEILDCSKKPSTLKGEFTMNTKIKTLMLIAVLLLPLVFAPTSHADFAALGPLDPANGFPAYIQDSTGLSLGLCLDQNPLCVLTPLFDPAFTFPPNTITAGPASAITGTNFPDENFLWLADALMNFGPTLAAKASFRLATEGAFGAAVQNGQQIMFNRVNLRVAALPGDLPPNTQYTVTYPFGTFTFDTDATGIPIKQAGVTARLEDGCFAAVCLTDPATMLATPFTKFDKFLGCAAGGPFIDPVTGHLYIGNPAVACTLQPGILGNFFRIAGTNAGGVGVPTIQTTQWTVAGKIVGMTASPASVAFAPQMPAVTTASAVITFTNPDATASATLGAGTITGLNAADFIFATNTCSGATLAANGGTCTLTVNFLEPAPGVFGLKSAVVSFPVTTPLNKPPVVVNLTGVIDNIAPTVVSTLPVNGDQGWPLNNRPHVIFSEPVTGISSTTFIIKDAGGVDVGGTPTLAGGTIADYALPAGNLQVNATYTATLTPGITDLVGNPLAQVVFSFKTTVADTVAPTVQSTTPAKNATGVRVNDPITATFAGTVDPGDVNATTFFLSDGVTGAVTFDHLNGTATLKPDKPLEYFHKYTATVKGGATGITSLGQVPMAADFTWSFLTNGAPDAPALYLPADGTTGVTLPVDLKWIKVTDIDGEPVTYKLWYCTNPAMLGCTPVDVAESTTTASSSLRDTLAGLGGYGAGMLLAGIAVVGGVRSRRKIFFLIAVLAISGMAVTACSKKTETVTVPATQVGVDQSTIMTQSVSNLKSGTTYWWKVVADDGNGALVESATWRFTTQ